MLTITAFKFMIMVMLFFSCVDAQGEHRDCMYGGPTLEACFDTLNDLVRNGTQLISIQLRCKQLSTIQLPIEAFDGQSMSNSLKELEQEWKLALLT